MILLFFLLCLISSSSLSLSSSNITNILYVPLDERYATRGMWLNMVRMLSNDTTTTTTLSNSQLPLRKRSASPDDILNWMENQNNVSVAIVSLEMVLYGGLIASRVSNDTTSTILKRLDRFLDIVVSKKMPTYLSTVVMRIPSYDGDFEEPWYWETHGRDLYEYSFYLGEFRETRNETARREYERLENNVIPKNVLNEFLWRRQRNHNVTKTLIKRVSRNETMLRNAYVTLDDSGTYGLNVEEANELKNLTSNISSVRVYPGADEVGLTLLSKHVSSIYDSCPSVRIVWRVPGNATRLIPGYENQAIMLTVEDQLEAAGFRIINDTTRNEKSSLVFAINNFKVGPQLESSQQPDSSPQSDYDALFQDAFSDPSALVAFADVRYANGGDKSFVKYLLNFVVKKKINPTRFSYAGWNTDGNTLGTAASNGMMLLSQLKSFSQKEGARIFTYLRLLEDLSYQSEVRNMLISRVIENDGNLNDLTPELSEYESFVLEKLRRRDEMFSSVLNLSYPTLKSVYFPWNRTFEIGLRTYYSYS